MLGPVVLARAACTRPTPAAVRARVSEYGHRVRTSGRPVGEGRRPATHRVRPGRTRRSGSRSLPTQWLVVTRQTLELDDTPNAVPRCRRALAVDKGTPTDVCAKVASQIDRR